MSDPLAAAASGNRSTIPIIDVDSHVSEAPGVWTGRIASKRGEAVPHLERHPVTGLEHWRIGDVWDVSVSRYAHGGWKEFWPSTPPTLEECLPAAYDSAARLEHLNREGIYAQVLYPNLLAFSMAAFLKLETELRTDCVRAYSDWQIEYASADPNRLVPLAFLPVWDIDAAVAEFQRCIDLGFKGLNFGWQFEKIGFPVIADEHWHPIMDMAQYNGLSVNFHIGTAAISEATSLMPREDVLNTAKVSTLLFLGNANCIAELIMTGLCDRYPRLNFVSVESGFGFVSYLLEALDWQFLNVGAQRRHPGMLLPSEYFERQIYASFWFERNVGRLIDLYPDNVMFETDFPHPSGVTPGPGSAALTPVKP